MAKPGRPSKYTDALANKICKGISEGKSLTDVLKAEGMPNYSTVTRWLREDKYEGFRAKYARAREEQGDWYADKIHEIAMECEKDRKRFTYDGSRVAIDALKWLAAKRKPKVYGDLQKLEHSGAGGAPLKITIERPGDSDD